MPKTITTINDQLYDYLLETWLREPQVLKELREQTAKLEMSIMQISPDQAQFMAFLVKLIDARKIIEVGTFTGYSALAMALATHAETKIVCCDVSEEWTNVGKPYWTKAGVTTKIDLRLGPALDTLKEVLVTEKGQYDFAFIDTDKINYDAYFEHCLHLLRPGGLIGVDNVFWGGSVTDQTQQDEDTKAIRALNIKLRSDQRIDLCVVPIGDGLTVARKR